MANWHEIATKEDELAQNFYTQLVAQRMEGTGWQDSWVELPEKLYTSFSRGIHARAVSYFFDGFDWRTVLHYVNEPADAPMKIYLRLPADGEIVEEQVWVEFIAETP